MKVIDEIIDHILETHRNRLVTCPFCDEEDFDLVGLKSHLVNGDCEEFNKVPLPNRVF